jgi:CheY-like chemotaxis protein
LVDDDPIAVRIYRDGLARRGFEVSTATDGLAALKALRTSNPQVVVLDLMMPKLSGVEVLKFIRSQPELQSLPVIVLSNAYMDSLAKDASRMEVQKALLKIKCNADSLAAAIREVLEGRPDSGEIDQLLAAPSDPPAVKAPPLKPAAPAPPRREPLPPAAAVPPPHMDQSPAPLTPAGLDTKEVARQELALCSERFSRQLRECLELFSKAHEPLERKLRLEDLYRKVHFLTGLAALADYSALAQMASAFEALVFGLMDKLPEPQPSMELTTAQGVAFLQELLQRPAVLPAGPQNTPTILVVDDDRLTTRMVVTALRNAQLQARGTESPELALQWMKERPYDLVLLDVEMPGMNGFELCQRLRALPGYDKTPVIYVTFHSDFETHSKSQLSGGNDLISKPIVSMELAVKAVMHLLKSRLAKAD